MATKKKAAKPAETVTTVKGSLKLKSGKPAEVTSSKVAYEGPLFNVLKEQVKEPGLETGIGSVERDIIRHNGSVVILAVDESKSKKDPYVVVERQYRHAAGQFLYELPAGKVDAGEERLAAAKRELIEETGFRAKKWTKLSRYYASPGFLGEWMQVYLAEGLTLGDATPEADERIQLFLVPLSELLRLIEGGKIEDGKTILSVLLYARMKQARKKA
ncbi:NUDIX hydrolase [Silvibacterium sp.]|uniref:NUDIX hydrolase n=1 Tax=Silvibacterium sp. TaxID=1964179 RepID=UPI0039E444A8